MSRPGEGEVMGHRELVARQVVLCGSMKAIGQMEEIACLLKASGIRALTPTPDHSIASGGPDAIIKQKHVASKLHMSWIMAAETLAILVVNPDREHLPNYIGPNAFGEIAVAFANDRAVFVLNGYPQNYEEELQAWRVQPLNGDLDPVVALFEHYRHLNSERHTQDGWYLVDQARWSGE